MLNKREKYALELAWHKAMDRLKAGYSPYLDETDLNEIFVVGGMPLLPTDKGESDEYNYNDEDPMDIINQPLEFVEPIDDDF